MSANPWRSAGDSGSGRLYIKHATETGEGWSIHAQGMPKELKTIIPIGTPVIIDWLTHRAGPLKWKEPQDFTMLTPVDREAPPVPTGYLDGTAVNMLFRGHPVIEFATTGKYSGRALYALHWAYAHDSKAETGMLPIYLVQPPQGLHNATHGQMFYKFVLKPTGQWVARDEGVFGPALIQPPRPRLLHDGAAAAIPPAEPATAATDAIFANVVEIEEIPAPTPPPAAPPTPPPAVAKDLFAGLQTPPTPAVRPAPVRSTTASKPRVLPVP